MFGQSFCSSNIFICYSFIILPDYHVCGTLDSNDLMFFYFLLVKALLEELECLVEDVYGTTLTASFSALKVSDTHSIDNKLTTESCIMEVEVSVPTFVFLVPYVQSSVHQRKTCCFQC